MPDLNDHLARARAARSDEGKRRGVDIINATRERKPCECDAGDAETDWRKHKAACPVCKRGRLREHRQKKETGR